ncbi:MAG: hypothetical protein HYS13_02050 [Planctomycetia bacterium]|nr:hypothetical protein [Planctomycetia bacterium]
MPIQFACPSCQKQFRVADSMAGQQARCSCGQIVTVPGPKTQAAAPPSTPRSASFDRLLQEAQDAVAAKRAAEEAARAERAAAEAAKAAAQFAPHGRMVIKVPHRGGTVLVLALLGWFICPLLSLIAWNMGRGDLQKMDAGQMDDSGRGLTTAGKIIGMVTTLLFVLSFLAGGIGALFLFLNLK